MGEEGVALTGEVAMMKDGRFAIRLGSVIGLGCSPEERRWGTCEVCPRGWGRRVVLTGEVTMWRDCFKLCPFY